MINYALFLSSKERLLPVKGSRSGDGSAPVSRAVGDSPASRPRLNPAGLHPLTEYIMGSFYAEVRWYCEAVHFVPAQMGTKFFVYDDEKECQI